ncbi:MAG: type 4a pilus biogenesis protein PilO [Gammaproteobacteria bacterium]|nr:type 4a pilus biogenesis protein PilO [Gammaproteobacteria bacterium]MCW8982821.1 type 4a pilus biogenesis protein PilO [Gammaproteobacteria bacterium]
MKFDITQYQNLDPENMGSWPLAARVGVLLAVCIGVLVAGYYLDISDVENRLQKATNQETELKTKFEKGQMRAVNLAAYQQQMREMEESFGTMLRQLPSRTEVADLLIDITQTGLASGLSFELFEPKGEVPQEFYAELPIALKIMGNFHEFGEFVSGVAALPRIVTLHEISLLKGKESGDKMTFEAVAKTYRYLDEDEIAANKSSKRKKGKKGK